MSEWISVVAMPTGVFVAGWCLLCLLIGGAYRSARGSLASLNPSQHSFVLLAVALAPIVVSGLVTLLVYAPQFGGPILDNHCHSELCTPHVPAMNTSGWFALPVALVILLVTSVALAILGHALVRAIGLGRTLLAIAGERRRSFDVLETQTPGAWCVGLLRPRILVSKGLMSLLAGNQLAVVLAHERAHALRRDNLRHLAAGIGTWLMPRGTRRQLLADLRLAAEQACDRRAARELGSPRQVAETLLAVRKACGSFTRRATASAFCPDATDARIAALTDGSAHTVKAVTLVLPIALVYILLTAMGTTAVHHGLEILPGIIAR